MNLAGLGALAGGLNDGLVRGQNRLDTLAERDRVAARQKRLDDHQDKQWAREDADLAAMDQANAAGREVMQRYADEWKKQQPGPTLDGSPVPVNPFQPTPNMMLEAGRARTDKLLELKGPTEAWAQLWAKDETMRSSLRAQAGQRVKAAMVGGQDPTQALTEFFGTINDGYAVTGVKRLLSIDGKPTLQVQRVNRYSGQPVDALMIPAEQLVRDIDTLSANPVDLAKHSLQMNLEAFKQVGEVNKERVKGDEDRKTEGVKNTNKLGQIVAEGDQHVRQEGAKSRYDATKPYTLGDGQERWVDQAQPDGTIKPVKIAGNRKDTPAARATTAKQINDMVIGNFGVLDVGTGRQVGSSTTQALSAAAERLMNDNPGLGANEAIAEAAKDMGLNLVRK